MAATETSSASSVLRPLSPSQRLEKNINLRLKKRSTAPALLFPKKRKCCLCYPTAHPGSYRCAFHRPLAKENIETLDLKAKRRRSEVLRIILDLVPKRRRCSFTTSNSGLNLRKTALMNSLARFKTVEAERCRKWLKESLVKPSSPRFRCKFRPRPRPSRFSALRKDKD